jgi:alpha-glucoside transport system permease protein
MGLKIANALIAVVAGVLGSMVLFWVLNKIVELFPPKWEERLKPYVFIGPALAAIIIFLIYPAITTIYASFLNSDSTAAVGIANYTALLGERDFQSALVNNLLWLIIVPASVVALGLLVATLADRLSARSEKLAKTLIFMPMAIAMVAASTIWRFIYDVKPAGEQQIGMLNAVVTAFGADPVNWLQLSTLRFNSFLLMIVFMWTQIGFSMVLLSAAIKAVPDDTVEAGRIDGASERQIFFRIVVPQVWPTVITVFITVLISVLKVFDVVYVMTNGQFNTNVIGNAFFNELFKNGENGRASAIVVMLMIVIIPVLIYQVRQFRAQEMIQ